MGIPDGLAYVLAAYPDEAQAIMNSKELRRKIEDAYAASKLETPQPFENVREWLRKSRELEDRIANFKIETHEDRGRLVMLRVERDSVAKMAGEMMQGLGVRIYKRALDMK